MKRNKPEMEFIFQIQNMLKLGFDKDDNMPGIAAAIQDYFDSDFLFFYLVETKLENCVYGTSELNGLDVAVRQMFEFMAQNGEPVFIPDFLDSSNPYQLSGPILSVMSIPFRQQNDCLGHIQLANSTGHRSFSEKDFLCLKVIAGLLFTEIQKMELIIKQKKQLEYIHLANKELADRTRQILRELEMAQRVQQAMIAASSYARNVKELNIGFKCMFVESLGGDLIDVIHISKNHFGFLIADVSGHGVPAALVSAMAKVSFNTHAKPGINTDKTLQRVNEDLFKLIGDLDCYVAAYYGILDIGTGLFQYSNAGHHSAIHIDKNNKSMKELDASGFVIGFQEKSSYEVGEVKLEAGDRLLMVTDGIIEARNKEGEFFEDKCLNDFILGFGNKPPQDFIDRLFQNVEQFSTGTSFDDDRAALYIEYVSQKPPDKNEAFE